ncbi:hypothetical protein C5Y41_15525 [Rahnella variigena]|uniref:hypothetical protein n=1 Tax=Rahnella variigena TaxID=574964 RepID=UPI00101BB57D|nr:hypothetical protein [Rahnella variigena]RYJ18556.1 hypothetical protein C5Y41_15525 [Rahnella variigena]
MTISLIDLAICTVAVMGFILGIITIVLSCLNKKRFIKICVLYEKEFGSLPLSVQTFYESDIIGFSEGYAMKIQFIINPIIFGKKSAHSKFNDVVFMQNLPGNLKNWFIIEYLLSVAGLVLLVISGVCLYFR